MSPQFHDSFQVRFNEDDPVHTKEARGIDKYMQRSTHGAAAQAVGRSVKDSPTSACRGSELSAKGGIDEYMHRSAHKHAATSASRVVVEEGSLTELPEASGAVQSNGKQSLDGNLPPSIAKLKSKRYKTLSNKMMNNAKAEAPEVGCYLQLTVSVFCNFISFCSAVVKFCGNMFTIGLRCRRRVDYQSHSNKTASKNPLWVLCMLSNTTSWTYLLQWYPARCMLCPTCTSCSLLFEHSFPVLVLSLSCVCPCLITSANLPVLRLCCCQCCLVPMCMLLCACCLCPAAYLDKLRVASAGCYQVENAKVQQHQGAHAILARYGDMLCYM